MGTDWVASTFGNQVWGYCRADALCQWKHTAAVSAGFAFKLRRKNDEPSHPLPRHLFLHPGRSQSYCSANDKTHFKLPQLWNMLLPPWLKVAVEYCTKTTLGSSRRWWTWCFFYGIIYGTILGYMVIVGDFIVHATDCAAIFGGILGTMPHQL